MDERDLERPAERRAEIHVPYKMDDAMIDDLKAEDVRLQEAVRNLNEFKRKFRRYDAIKYIGTLLILDTFPKLAIDAMNKTYFNTSPQLALFAKIVDNVLSWGYIIYTFGRTSGKFDFILEKRFHRVVNIMGTEIANRLHNKWKSEGRVKDEILEDEEEREPRVIIY